MPRDTSSEERGTREGDQFSDYAASEFTTSSAESEATRELLYQLADE
jgi:hypothetical protein